MMSQRKKQHPKKPHTQKTPKNTNKTLQTKQQRKSCFQLFACLSFPFCSKQKITKALSIWKFVSQVLNFLSHALSNTFPCCFLVPAFRIPGYWTTSNTPGIFFTFLSHRSSFIFHSAVWRFQLHLSNILALPTLPFCAHISTSTLDLLCSYDRVLLLFQDARFSLRSVRLFGKCNTVNTLHSTGTKMSPQ